MSLYLSRLRLARNPQIGALRQLLDPPETGRALDAHHRLIWSVFADDPDRQRDFLWRAAGEGLFYTLSVREPVASPFFDAIETRAFAPDLRAGDRLEFTLRVNATVTRKTETEDGRRRHFDIVMHQLRHLPSGRESDERRQARMEIAAREGQGWLARQGSKAGFSPLHIVVGDYSTVALPGCRGPRRGQPQFGIMDMTGELEIGDPPAFLAALGAGFGRAKSFGCGLMLIRRAWET